MKNKKEYLKGFYRALGSLTVGVILLIIALLFVLLNEGSSIDLPGLKVMSK